MLPEERLLLMANSCPCEPSQERVPKASSRTFKVMVVLPKPVNAICG